MVLQAALFFILGISLTVFILLLVAPFVWRRVLFFARKFVAHQLPFSLREVEADRNFLLAQHAVEMSRQQEKFKLLQRINDEQSLMFAKHQEQLLRLQKIEEKNLGVENELVAYKDNLIKTKKNISQVVAAQSKNAEQVRDLFFAEKLSRVDIASYEKLLQTIEEKLQQLTVKYDKLLVLLDKYVN